MQNGVDDEVDKPPPTPEKDRKYLLPSGRDDGEAVDGDPVTNGEAQEEGIDDRPGSEPPGGAAEIHSPAMTGTEVLKMEIEAV